MLDRAVMVLSCDCCYCRLKILQNQEDTDTLSSMCPLQYAHCCVAEMAESTRSAVIRSLLASIGLTCTAGHTHARARVDFVAHFPQAYALSVFFRFPHGHHCTCAQLATKGHRCDWQDI